MAEPQSPTPKERAHKIERQIYHFTGRGLLALKIEDAVLEEIRAAVAAERASIKEKLCERCRPILEES